MAITKLSFTVAQKHAEGIRHHDAYSLAHKLALGIEIMGLKSSYGIENGKGAHIPGPDGVELSWPQKVTLETGFSYATIQRWMGMAEALAAQRKALGTLLKSGDPERVLGWLMEATEGMADGELKAELGLITKRETLEEAGDTEPEPAKLLGGTTTSRTPATESSVVETVMAELDEITSRLHQLVTARSHSRIPVDALALHLDALEGVARQIREDVTARNRKGKKSHE